MSAAIVAVYSLMGGVGKTTLAVNRARAAATLAGRRTLLWDLDALADASFVLGHAFEAMTDRRAPLGVFAARSSPGVAAVEHIRNKVERSLAEIAQ